MPTGPKGEKRPADVIGNAVKVMRSATRRARRQKVDAATTGGPARHKGLSDPARAS
jgi:hypothetical protein